MADIFLSYAREDRDRVQDLVDLLEEQGWSVWWDREILPGSRYEQIIDEAIREARCVVVVWTTNSIASDWVNAEAGDGLDRGILVPVMLESVRLPLAFRRWQAARLLGWPKRRNRQEMQLLIEAVDNVLHGRKPAQMTPGQKRPAGLAIRIQWAALALGAALLISLGWIGWQRSPAPISGPTQIAVLDVEAEGQPYLAQSFTFEVSRELKRQPGLTTTDAPDAEYRLASRTADGRIILQLLGPGEDEPLLDGLYALDAERLQAAAREATRDIIAALGKPYQPPADDPLSGDDLVVYLEATRALREADFTTSVDELLTRLEAVLERNPRHSPTMIALCRMNLRAFTERRTPIYFENAERHCHRAMTLDRRSVEGNLALGTLYGESGMRDEAITVLLDVTTRQPYNTDALRALGETYLEVGQADLAAMYLDNALQLEPGSWRNHKALGNLAMDQGRYDEAVERYWEAVNLAANKAERLNDLAAALYLSEAYDDAVDVWLQSAELEPSPVTYSNLGSTYFFLGRFAQAAEMYELAIELAPDDYVWWGHAGEAHLQMPRGRPDRYFAKAVELASRTSTINPNDHQLLSSLATYHAALGDTARARELIGAAKDMQPADMDVLYDEAVVWSRLGDLPALESTLGQLVSKGYPAELIDRDANFNKSSRQGESEKAQ